MRRQFIKQPLPSWARSLFTAPHSRELKNTSQDRGRLCEAFAWRHYKKRHYQLIARNQRLAGVEVDLILRKDCLVIVEVKSLRHCSEIGFRLGNIQIKRLMFAREVLSEQTGESVELRVAFVKTSGQITELPIEAFI